MMLPPLSVEFFLDLLIERDDEGLITAKLVVPRVVTAVFPRGVLMLNPFKFLLVLFDSFLCVKDDAVLLKEAVESSLC